MSEYRVGPAEPESICVNQNYLFYLMQMSRCDMLEAEILTDNICKYVKPTSILGVERLRSA